MARKPMKAHEKRPLRMFMPELNKICDVTLQARTSSRSSWGTATKRPLFRVDQTTMVDGKPRPEFDARVYVDAEGRSSSPSRTSSAASSTTGRPRRPRWRRPARSSST